MHQSSGQSFGAFCRTQRATGWENQIWSNESDLIQGSHHIPRTTLNKLFPAVEITILPKAIYRFNAVCIKLPMVFLIELEQKILQCVWKYKTPWRAKTILRKKSRSWQDQAPWLQSILQAIVIKGSRTIQWRKDRLLNKQCWETWTATCIRMKSEHSLTPSTKTNSKWIKDQNVRIDIIKLLNENIGRTPSATNYSNIFFDPHLKSNEHKNKNKHMGPH